MSSLSFVSVLVGQILAMIFSYYLDKRYKAWLSKHNGIAPPEQRLMPCLVGSVAMPVGLFWFAFTTYVGPRWFYGITIANVYENSYPEIPWIVSMIGASFFGFGQVLVFLGVINYLVDSCKLAPQ